MLYYSVSNCKRYIGYYVACKPLPLGFHLLLMAATMHIKVVTYNRSMITAQLERVEKLNICMQLAKYKKIHLQYF
jgi:hypothetical protein